MVTVADYLQARGIDVAEDDLATALGELLGDHLVAEDSAGLTREAHEVLTRVAPAPRPRALASATASTAAASVELLGTAHPVDQVARDLGIDPSRVRHRVADGALHAIRVGRRVLLPDWQFHRGAPLPGLRGILSALPGDLHPLEVAGFMTGPQPELEIRSRAVSPRTWLAAGGDPEPVIDLARSLAVPA